MTLDHSEFVPESPRGHYVFIDGPSLDRTLGEVLGGPPTYETRPDWRRVERFVRETLGDGAYHATFAVWSPNSPGFVSFLQNAGFNVAFGERYTPGQSCADVIRNRIGELNAHADLSASWQVIVGTQSTELIESLPTAASHADRIIAFGFTEYMPDDELIPSNVEVYDIEDDANLFRAPLPRAAETDPGIDEPSMRGEPAAGTEGTLSLTTEAPVGGAAMLASPAPQSGPQTGPPSVAAAESAVSSSDAQPPASQPVGRKLYFVIDGHNVDKELGEILGGKPDQRTRPNWRTVYERVRSFSRADHGEVTAVFAHIAPGHSGFKRALTEFGYQPHPVRPDLKETNRTVVTDFVRSLLAGKTLRGEDGSGRPAPDLIVICHDESVFEAMASIPDHGQRLTALGFTERMPVGEQYSRIERLDLEHDLNAFDSALERDFGIDVDNFDPDSILAKLG